MGASSSGKNKPELKRKNIVKIKLTNVWTNLLFTIRQTKIAKFETKMIIGIPYIIIRILSKKNKLLLFNACVITIENKNCTSPIILAHMIIAPKCWEFVWGAASIRLEKLVLFLYFNIKFVDNKYVRNEEAYTAFPIDDQFI